MFAELGLFALILAVSLLIFQLVSLASQVFSSVRVSGANASFSLALSWLVFGLVGLSFILLIVSLLADEFGVKYVVQHSSSLMPWYYKVAAAWGAHEGSLLLWALMLLGWQAWASVKTSRLGKLEQTRLVFLLAGISLSFLLFVLLTSSPFARLLSPVAEGSGLNPMLQDWALIMHPPLLYMGYVGLAVGFAWAVVQLWMGELNPRSVGWIMSWTLVAWVFLTLGIALGSWWAYYELGWGGWWFWDPVENASLLPWLVATALFHSLLVAQRRQLLYGWVMFLAIMAFAMSLVGAFLVRSGVLTSVHAFASDPARGSFILLFLVVVIGSALVLFSWRAPKVIRQGALNLVSRESALLFNNLLLLVIAASILLGTLYPMVLEAVGRGQISVGAPYFNLVVLSLAVPLVVLMGLGLFSLWREDSWLNLLRKSAAPLAVVVVTWLVMVFFQVNWLAQVGVVLGLWVGSAAVFWALGGFVRARRFSLSVFATALAHLGFGVFILGMTFSAIYGVEQDVRVVQGESVEFAGYELKFLGVEEVAGPNYLATRGAFALTKQDSFIGNLYPEKRVYLGESLPMTEVAIHGNLVRDFYLAMGEELGANSWAVRIQYKPWIRLIWLGAIFMALGGFLAVVARLGRGG